MIKQKLFDIKKAEDGKDTGIIEGYASTWIREPDAYGDIVKQGAFSKSLQKLHDEGKTIPLIWAHQLDNLKSYIGTATADEDEKGLHFVAQFEDTPEAQKVREMYKDGRLSKFSFAYDVKDQAPVTLDDGRVVNELRELDIYEISCVLVPANSDASVIDVKAGKRNNAKDEQTIKDAIALLEQLLSVVTDDKNEETEEHPENDGKANAPKAEEQNAINERKSKLLDFINKMEA